MSQNNRSDTQPSGISSTLLQLRAHKIILLVEQLGIISNEIQAAGAILESLGAAITFHGNKIGTDGFRLEQVATRLHIISVEQELKGEGEEPNSSLLIQLRAYYMLLTANMMGALSNEIQAFGALIQAIAGIVVAYGNLLTVEAFEIETIATRLQIVAALQELEKERDRSQTYEPPEEDGLKTSQLMASKPKSQADKLQLKIEHLENIIERQQAQIDEIKRELDQIKGNA